MKLNRQLLDAIIAFLNNIGIETIIRPIPGHCFLPGVSMEAGKIIIDTEKLLYPGDILHEAGHIAVMPPEVRSDMDEVLPSTDLHQGGEMMALAWSYAACVHIGIDPHVVFHADGYKGDGEQLAKHYNENPAIGIPMLQWCGMTCDSKKAKELNKLPFPAMQFWLRQN